MTVTELRPGTVQPGGQSLTAAAKKIDYTSAEDKARYRKRQRGWQDEAWRYYDECGEIWFGTNFVANCLRKIRLYAGVQTDVSEPPVPIEILDDDGKPLTLNAEEAQAVDLVERLSRADGGIGGIMAAFGLTLSVAGESVLVGKPDEAGNERWGVFSTDQVFVNQAGQWSIRTSPQDKKGQPLDTNTSVAYRVWRVHPRWASLADSAMRPLLDVVEELLILSRAIRATGRSRLAGAGVLLWPQEANLGGSAPLTTQSVSAEVVDPVLADLMQAMMTPIGDEGVAAAVVPLLLRLPSEYIDKVKHLLFERPIDPEMAKQREELRRRIASGLDIPAEVLLGLQDLNHWNAWMVDEQTFKAHLEPLVIQICSSLTSAYLLPNLGITDELESDLLIWYDPSALIGHPNRGQDAKDAWDRYLLSDDATRRYLGFSEEDAPDDSEVQARAARKALERLGPLRTGETLGEVTDVTAKEAVEPGIPATGPAAGKEPRPTAPAGGGSSSGPGPAAPVAPAAARAALVASIAPHRMRKLGMKLAARDRDLRTRLLAAADAAMFRTLERAGATLRRHSSKDTTVRAVLTDVPNHLVAARLGGEAVLALGVDTQTMIEDSFDNLSMRFDREVQRAQQEQRDLFDQLDEDNELDMDAIAQSQADHRREAAALLVAALTALATARLFNPHPEAPPIGEHDIELLVPPGYLREALQVAAGAAPPGSLDGIGEPGVGGGIETGTLATDVWNQLGVGPQGYEWFVGAPARPFEPHQDLDGVEFASFDDDVLGADAGEFPYVDHYFPGDHWGCQCDFAPILG